MNEDRKDLKNNLQNVYFFNEETKDDADDDLVIFAIVLCALTSEKCDLKFFFLRLFEAFKKGLEWKKNMKLSEFLFTRKIVLRIKVTIRKFC